MFDYIAPIAEHQLRIRRAEERARVHAALGPIPQRSFRWPFSRKPAPLAGEVVVQERFGHRPKPQTA